MSLINQMLQDLDARRASGTELALVPRYVRALPRDNRSRAPWWFGAAGAAIGISVAVGWHVMSQPARAPENAPVGAQPAPPAAPAAATGDAAMQPAAPQPVQTTAIPASAVVAREPAAPPVATSGATPAALQPVPAAARPAASVAEPPRIAKAPEPAERVDSAPRTAVASDQRAKPSLATVAPTPAAPAAAASPQIDKRVPPQTPSQLAETDYRDGANLVHQGRSDAAQEKFRSALHHLPGHTGARQALTGLLIAARRNSDAEQVLQEGLRVNPAQPGLAMTLARLQVDRGDTAAAIETLRTSGASAAGSADYVAFLAALLQRQSRHAEAVEHYQTALSLAPGNGIWQMGIGISLQALNRQQEARMAYRRALAAHTLSPELAAFVDQQLKQLN